MSLTRVLSLGGAGALLIAAGIANAQRPAGSASRTVLGASDQRFIEQVARGGQTEVALGKLGVEKATNPQVKEFAQKLVDDHTKMNTELEALAREKGVTLSMSPGKDPTETRLSAMSGAAFDKAFMQHMVTDHQKDVAMFERESKTGTDAEVKEFASKNLPTLRGHLDTAKAIKP